MDAKNLLISTLESFGYPIYLQGSMAKDDAYPASFFTFWNNSADDAAFYDNEEHDTIWNFDLNFYSNDPDLANTVLLEAKPLLKEAGFILNGSGFDVVSDEPTHTGRCMELYYIEKVR